MYRLSHQQVQAAHLSSRGVLAWLQVKDVDLQDVPRLSTTQVDGPSHDVDTITCSTAHTNSTWGRPDSQAKSYYRQDAGKSHSAITCSVMQLAACVRVFTCS